MKYNIILMTLLLLLQLGTNAQTSSKKYSEPSKNIVKTSIGYLTFNKEYTSSLQLSLGYERKLSKRLFIESNLKVSNIDKKQNDSINFLGYLPLNFGIGYTFKKNNYHFSTSIGHQVNLIERNPIAEGLIIKTNIEYEMNTKDNIFLELSNIQTNSDSNIQSISINIGYKTKLMNKYENKSKTRIITSENLLIQLLLLGIL